MSNIVYVSQETLEQMREELNKLKTTGRSEIAHAISEAREKGDLRENAEYDAAKEAQGMHEAKIAQLENALANARVLDTTNIDLSKVTILSKIRITNLKTNKELNYQLVSESEADLKLGKISVTSPIGKGLLGQALGAVVDVATPNGVIQFRVEEISI